MTCTCRSTGSSGSGWSSSAPSWADVPKILLVTNDFPPRPGGIQSFLYGLVSRLPSDDVVVYTWAWGDWEAWDAEQPFHVVREDTSVLLPTAGVRRRAPSLFPEHERDVAS